MKRIFCLSVLMMLLALPVASQGITVFGGVPFTGDLELFAKKMLEKGFEYYEDDGEEVFIGKYLGDDVEVFMRVNRNTGKLILVSAVIINKDFTEQTAVKKVKEIAGKLAQMYKIQNWSIKDLGGQYKASVYSKDRSKEYKIGVQRTFNLDLGKYLVATSFVLDFK